MSLRIAPLPPTPRPSPPRVDAAYRRAHHLLTIHPARLDFRVTVDDAHEALRTLAALPAPGLHAVLDTLRAEGTFTTLLRALDDEGRFALLTLLAVEVLDSPRPRPPPTSPATLR